MNVLVATDGSKYGRWGLNWVAKLPFVERPCVIALHVLDLSALREPISSTCSAVTYGRSTNGSLATQFSPHRPYFDPSVATSTFMVRLLSFEFPARSTRQAETGCEMPPATAPRG